jgi:hypothetical protein
VTRVSSDTLARVSRAVRGVVDGIPALAADPKLARSVEQRMLGVSLAAAGLLEQEKDITAALSRKRAATPTVTALAAGDINRQTAVQNAAGILKATRDAIDFPGFVTSLINGVFQAIQNSSIQQLQAVLDLLEAVSTSVGDFAKNQIGQQRAAAWAVSRFGAFQVDGEGDELQLSVKDDAEMPSPEELKAALGATEDEVSTVSEGDLAQTLLPLVQRKLARDRQAMLSTMIMMGLQRVVVDDGSIHASMRLDVDARSIAEQRSFEQFDTRVSTEGSGSFGVGAWGASAKMAASVGYVKSDEQLSREDIAVSAGLRSSVDVRFRTVPFDTKRVASNRTLDQIRNRALVPEVEKEAAPGSLLSEPKLATSTPKTQSAPAPPEMGTQKLAEQARLDAAQREKDQQAADKKGTPTDKKSPTADKKSPPADKAGSDKQPPTDKASDAKTPASDKPVEKSPVEKVVQQ